nr:uncharacterized protein LOC9269032 isoform X1 [Oryza sativa Japonica Group]
MPASVPPDRRRLESSGNSLNENPSTVVDGHLRPACLIPGTASRGAKTTSAAVLKLAVLSPAPAPKLRSGGVAGIQARHQAYAAPSKLPDLLFFSLICFLQLLFCHLCKNKKSLGVAAVVQGIDVIHAVAIRLGDSAALVLQFVDQGAAEYAVEHTLHKMRGRHRGGRLKMKLDVKKMDFDERTMWKMDFDDRVMLKIDFDVKENG